MIMGFHNFTGNSSDFKRSEVSNIHKDSRPLHIFIVVFRNYQATGGGNCQIL
jgi:hypothetical protein